MITKVTDAGKNDELSGKMHKKQNKKLYKSHKSKLQQRKILNMLLTLWRRYAIRNTDDIEHTER